VEVEAGKETPSFTV